MDFYEAQFALKRRKATLNYAPTSINVYQNNLLSAKRKKKIFCFFFE